MTTSVQISPQDALKQLENLPELMKQALPPAMERIGVEFKSTIIVYPPIGDWNMQGSYPKRWYQRLKGQRWARRDGGVGGLNTSKQLQQNWDQTVSDADVSTYTEVPYAEYVMGDSQASFHADHGWVTAEEKADAYADRAAEIVLEEAVKLVE